MTILITHLRSFTGAEVAHSYSSSSAVKRLTAIFHTTFFYSCASECDGLLLRLAIHRVGFPLPRFSFYLLHRILKAFKIDLDDQLCNDEPAHFSSLNLLRRIFPLSKVDAPIPSLGRLLSVLSTFFMAYWVIFIFTEKLLDFKLLEVFDFFID